VAGVRVEGPLLGQRLPQTAEQVPTVTVAARNSRKGYRARGVGHPRRHAGGGDPEASHRNRLPGLVAGAAPSDRADADHGGGTYYLLGVSTRRMEKLVETLGITRLSKSQVSGMAKELDEQVDAEFRAQALYFQFSGGWQLPLSKMKRRIVPRSGGRTPRSGVCGRRRRVRSRRYGDHIVWSIQKRTA